MGNTHTVEVVSRTKRTCVLKVNGDVFKMNQFGILFAEDKKNGGYFFDFKTPYMLSFEVQDILAKLGVTYVMDKEDRKFDYSVLTKGLTNKP